MNWGKLASALAIATQCLAAWGNSDVPSGSEVVVVFNSRVPESREIAQHYAKMRGVPKRQVFGFDLPITPDISRADFRSELQVPLARALKKADLWDLGEPRANDEKSRREKPVVVRSRIRYAVLCYGVPYRIVRDPTLKEEGTETWQSQLRRNEAAVDSELALLPKIERNLVLAGPLANPAFNATNRALLHPTNGVLMVTRLDGPSPEIARALVDKAMEAERNGLWGRAYFDIRSIQDSNYIVGDELIRRAAEMCRRLGYETVMDTNGGTFPQSFPMSQIAYYVGWYDQTVSGPFRQPEVEFMPGAFAYHLHSFSAASLRSTNDNWVGPLLARGVTASMGAVEEPYLGGTPDMASFTARFLFERFTFGEAAYAAQAVLSWQMTVVGDPLYRPAGAGTNLEATHERLARENDKNVQWSTLRWINLNLASGRPPLAIATYLEALPLTRTSPVLTEKLAGLYDALGKPASATHAYEQVLKLEPSPQQRLRVQLTLADRYTAANREDEARKMLETVVEEHPTYPGVANVRQRIANLPR
jgi:uncharacterized protein (TIGR03790 family)